MSLPSITDASESMKKLQWARWRPSSASELPLPLLNWSWASQRCPDSCPRIDRALFSPRILALGSSPYLAARSMTRMLWSVPPLPKSADWLTMSDADAADRVRDRRLEGKGVGDDRRVGEEEQLIEAIGVAGVEAPRRLRGIELGVVGEALADRAGAAADP